MHLVNVAASNLTNQRFIFEQINKYLGHLKNILFGALKFFFFLCVCEISFGFCVLGVFPAIIIHKGVWILKVILEKEVVNALMLVTKCAERNDSFCV